jgi:hypothetical protein
MQDHGLTFTATGLEVATTAGRGGYFDGYASAIKRYALLERNQEQQLARRWREQRDRRATDVLVTSHCGSLQRSHATIADTDCRWQISSQKPTLVW